MSKVYLVGGMRTPFVKSFTSFKSLSTQKLMEHSLKALVKKFHLEGKELDDVGLGAVINSANHFNLARECVISSGLSATTPAYNIQRACGTSLEAAYQLFAKMKIDSIETGIAGGVDTNSAIPLEVNQPLRELLLKLQGADSPLEKFKTILNSQLTKLGIQKPGIVEKRTGLSMGEHCELMVKEWGVSQDEQDRLALQSHKKAALAFESGFYADLICTVEGISKDSFVRGDTSLEKLKVLKPAFDKTHGTITAGNASPLSDGASSALLANERGLKTLGLSPLAEIIDIQTAAINFVDGGGLLMAPTMAVAKLLKRNSLTLQDFDYYEIHEAFAGQVICTRRAWNDPKYCREILRSATLGEIDDSKLNVVGGSLALGHPFAATGTRLLASLAKLLKGTKKRGLISVCTAGGMGIAAILEGA